MHCSTTVPSIWHCQSIDQANVSVECVQCLSWHCCRCCWCPVAIDVVPAGILLPHAMPCLVYCVVLELSTCLLFQSWLASSPSSNGCLGASTVDVGVCFMTNVWRKRATLFCLSLACRTQIDEGCCCCRFSSNVATPTGFICHCHKSAANKAATHLPLPSFTASLLRSFWS